MLKLEQTERDFTHEIGLLILLVIEPSKSNGGWPGNKRVIRKWTVARPKSGHYITCTDEEVIALEKELGEVEVNFYEHPTLGRVATPRT